MTGKLSTTQGTSTFYDGPARVSTLTIAGQEIRLVRPADPDRLLEAPDVLAWNKRDDYMPYWAYLWPGAFLLAEAVAREPWPEGLTALEIGCGLGLAGLVGLARGLRVRFTDYDEAPLHFVARSAAENNVDPDRFSTARLDWRELPDEKFPIILAADVLYEHRLVPLVANLIHQMLAPEGVALVAGPYRVAAETFESHLTPLGLTSSVESLELPDTELGAVRGTVHRVSQRSLFDRSVPTTSLTSVAAIDSSRAVSSSSTRSEMVGS